ncbi:oxygen-independent coproporphyrinogen III oxidase [Algimonas porphyrae]|uniref:Coproporphyrinogen-III oxidase n=1 Tax=Algimonas porphyrae TaxID=1128113 RepID=A0ABQ5V3U9_9PROT|nr:oxygen-independent coproporphyrinogen III oxidase [Algimonas porphyrae]GLQ21639.1 coproporphyrinogen-III oxidase [Algimonas porphyrae]
MTTYPAELILNYSAPVPRYTSYPTAPNFTEAVNGEVVAGWLRAIPETDAVSLYIHIPFCDRLCWFCGCHTKHVQRYEPVRRYLDLLYREIEQVAARIGRRQPVARLHLGGGSPSLLKAHDLACLRAQLDAAFILDADTEISLEFDPTDMTVEDVESFCAFGVTRASLGVQDFDARVQAAINRPQSYEKTRDIITALRHGGVASVNIDALYGLPYQTDDTVRRTLTQVVELDPDRVALFGYAHVPWMKTHQRLIEDSALPDTLNRFRQSRIAASILKRNAYQTIGIDHFAKADDALSVAARKGTLRRNFQGYTVDECDTLIGLGASSISQFAQGYAQNVKSVQAYQRALEADSLPIERGIIMSDSDRVTAAAIEQLMCDFRLDSASLRTRFGERADGVLAKAALIAHRDEDGLFKADASGFHVTQLGRPFVRTIASRFDDYLLSRSGRYSVAV